MSIEVLDGLQKLAISYMLGSRCSIMMIPSTFPFYCLCFCNIIRPTSNGRRKSEPFLIS